MLNSFNRGRLFMKTAGVLIELKPSLEYIALFEFLIQLCVYGKQVEWLFIDGEYLVGTKKRRNIPRQQLNSMTAALFLKTMGFKLVCVYCIPTILLFAATTHCVIWTEKEKTANNNNSWKSFFFLITLRWSCEINNIISVQTTHFVWKVSN